ncbi:hypothetical protein [Terrisporobacter sp.]
MKILNKIFYTVSTVVEVLLILGIFIINYFTRTKMGMSRHVFARSFLWENSYNIPKLQHMSIILIAIIAILILIFFIKRKAKLKKIAFIENIIMIILVIIYSGFTLLYSTYDYKAFYYICLMLFVATIIQIIKSFFTIILCKKYK